jgi:hypothetical protein
MVLDAILVAPKASRSLYTRHKDSAEFDPVKFTPKTIHNKKSIDIDRLIDFFKSDHTLGDCAIEFRCSTATIKRRLRVAGVDTSIYNHSQIAVDRSKKVRAVVLPPDEEIRHMLVDLNLDTKTVAEEFGVHFNTIRNISRRLGIEKNRKDVAKSMSVRHLKMHGYRHPAQRPDVLAKTRRSSGRVKYSDINGRTFLFRSLHELGYALLLDKRGAEWQYEEMHVRYIDMLTGKQRIYVIDFTVESNGLVEWIEVKPNNKMIPDDKRIYASRRAEDAGVVYRGLVEEERLELWELLKSGYRQEFIQFMFLAPNRNAKQISYWFSSSKDATEFKLDGWRRHNMRDYGTALHTVVFRRIEQL